MNSTRDTERYELLVKPLSLLYDKKIIDRLSKNDTYTRKYLRKA